MKFTRQSSQRGEFDIVVTSMLDINFLLIMFFMMTAQFQKETRAQLELPQEKGEERTKVDESGMVINITSEGSIVISGQTMAIPDLGPLVRQQIEKHAPTPEEPLKIMVRADRRASAGDLNAVVTLLREMNVGTMRIATEIPYE